MDFSYGWDDDGDRYVHVKVASTGITKLRAVDWNENEKKDECTVYAGGAPVKGISLSQSRITIGIDDTEQLIAWIEPNNALIKDVTWKSDKAKVVSVDKNGMITGLKEGTATIKATTKEGGYSATCIVTVDKREKVTVKKDDHSFYVTFADGKVWKNIGIDLSNRQENYRLHRTILFAQLRSQKIRQMRQISARVVYPTRREFVKYDGFYASK